MCMLTYNISLLLFVVLLLEASPFDPAVRISSQQPYHLRPAHKIVCMWCVRCVSIACLCALCLNSVSVCIVLIVRVCVFEW